MDMTLWWIYLASRADVVWPLIVFRGDSPLVENEVGLIGDNTGKVHSFLGSNTGSNLESEKTRFPRD